MLDYRARDSAKSTMDKYRRHLRDYILWLESEGSPLDMWSLQGTSGYRLLKLFLIHLRDERRSAPGTVATIFRVLKTFFNWCVAESLDEDKEPTQPPYVRFAPTADFKKEEMPKDVTGDNVGEPYSEIEIKRLLNAFGPANSKSLEVLRNRAMTHTFIASGLRRQELARLIVADFDPETGVIRVRRSTAKQTNAQDDGRKAVLYGEPFREVSRYVRRLRADGKGNGPLFPSLKGRDVEHRGNHLRPDSITTMFDRTVKTVQAACKNAANHSKKLHRADARTPAEGCAECIRFGGIHRFRATWTINQSREGLSASAIKTLAGWNSYAMLDRYSRKAQQDLAIEEIRRIHRR
ncbi:MAG: tyrosine-type recombinase/integrase [Dehalococcoidia bacterium]